jgi:RNA polymerase sigma-B factor
MTTTASRPTADVLPPSAVAPKLEAVVVRQWMPWEPRSAAGVERPAAGLRHPDMLLDRLCRLAPGDAGRAAVRSEVIEWYLPLAVYLARRFNGRGEPLDDLTQVAVIGLMQAVDRFDASRGVPFVSYATPTILGGIKRHFRDTTWNVRVPRRLQELKLQLGTVTEELAHVLHRSPTTAELAARLDVTPEDVRTARVCANAYRAISFDQPLSGDGPGLIDTLGNLDPQIDAVDWHVALREGLAELSIRDRRIIALRFFADMTQTQIAVELGMSQMHVSRLLAQALARLRTALLAEDTDHSGERQRGGMVHGAPDATRADAAPRRR